MKKALLINETSLEDHIGSETVINNIHLLCKQNDIEVVGTLTRKEVENWIPRIKKRLKQTDLIIINGEGSLHDSPNWFNVLIQNILFDKKQLFKNHKIVLINSLWQNMEHPHMKEFLDKMDLITLRESISYDELIKDYKEDKKIFLIPDVIFATEIPDLNIGFGDSVVPEIDKELIKYYNYFPMHKSKSPDLYAYLLWLKSLNLHITGRFHGACLCILMGTPFFALKSNSHKIEGLLKDIKCEHLLTTGKKPVNIKNLDLLLLRGRMKEYRIEAKERIDELFMRIGEL